MKQIIVSVALVGFLAGVVVGIVMGRLSPRVVTVTKVAGPASCPEVKNAEAGDRVVQLPVRRPIRRPARAMERRDGDAGLSLPYRDREPVVAPPQVATASAPTPTPQRPDSWCDGAYDPARGSNFGPCPGYRHVWEVQSPGSSGSASSASPAASPAAPSSHGGHGHGGHSGHSK